MKWAADYKDQKDRKFVIKHGQKAGYYLYAYNKIGGEFFDGLQVTLQFAKEDALAEFGVPLEAWKQVE